MGIELVHFSDCGAFRSSNQDAYCVRIASSGIGTVAMAAVCDGMGGLMCGEVAGAAVVHAMSQWFENDLPDLLENGLEQESVFHSWSIAISSVHEALKEYGRSNNITLGTTLSVLLMTEKKYYIAHVGDSRVYMDSGVSIGRLTQDQTLAVREYLAGRINEAEFAMHPGHHMLLQCVGSKDVSPMFLSGALSERGAFLLCSDGFYHHISEEQLHVPLNSCGSREELKESILGLGDYARGCGERDNMTVVVLRWSGFEDMPVKTAFLDPTADDNPHLETHVSVTYTNSQPIDKLFGQPDGISNK